MGREEFYKKIYDMLSIEDITKIFQAFLDCPNCGSCDNCILDNHKIGCFKLRDLAMQKVIDGFGGDECGKNN